MGDRVSIQFRNGDEISVVLFSHWGGQAFPREALDYAKALKRPDNKHKRPEGYPLDRLEPETVMVDFIRDITKGLKRVESDLYLGKDENDGDNSDNGNFIIDLKEMKAYGNFSVDEID